MFRVALAWHCYQRACMHSQYSVALYLPAQSKVTAVHAFISGLAAGDKLEPHNGGKH